MARLAYKRRKPPTAPLSKPKKEDWAIQRRGGNEISNLSGEKHGCED
jgi:hypothetical protein